MRIIVTILTILTFISCSTKNDFKNRFTFANCDLDIPIVQIDYSDHYDSIRYDIQNQFKYDLCENCSWIDFKIPFEYDSKQGYLKIMVDFDYPICENCPVPIRLRNYYSIMINRNNQLLVNGEPMKIDSLRSSIIKYFDNVGNPEGQYPEKYEQVNLQFFWDRQTDISSIEKILTEISKAHLTFVEHKVAENGLEFCKLTNGELNNLKNKYPLRIEFELGKIDLKIPNIDKLEELKEIQIIDEDIEIEQKY
ncbi:MAG: hypothetical protein HQ522_18095 [Bacteroidetes bacterium]|nr:hypothetical protein [Bacteroidota bacterium]